eukprot:jgi/Botrbrau1/21629/Bobra.43_1s0031.1
MKTLFGLLVVAGHLFLARGWYGDAFPPLNAYPGDNNDFRRIGWGDDGYFRFSIDGARGYWSSNSWGGGIWRCEENCPSNYRECPPCQFWWEGYGCVSSNAPACQFASIASCGACNVWSTSSNIQLCTLSPGCGVLYGTAVPSTSAVAVTNGRDGAFVAGRSTACAVQGNGGCMISGDGTAAAASVSGSGMASAMASAGGRRLKGT